MAGIPERTYHRRLATLRSGDAPVKGPWPTPAVDAAEALAAKYAADWPAWGHRKIAAMMRADGHQASTSTVERALRRRGLLLPPGSGLTAGPGRGAEAVFRDPPRERNRVWQMDFSEFETARGGIWRICAVIDYATKYCLAATVTPTSRGQDALGCLCRAVDEAERVLDLDDLRADHGDGRGRRRRTRHREVPAPIAVVTDNGPCFRGGPRRARSPATTRCSVTSAPGPEPADQRRGRAILRHVEVRAPLPRPNRRRQRASDGDRPASATSTTASGHTKLSTIERRARPTSTRDVASH